MTLADVVPAALTLLAVAVWMSRLGERLRAIEYRQSIIMRHLKIDPAAFVSARVTALAADPTQQIAAIKAYRAETGIGLRDAAAAVRELGRSPRPQD